MLYAKIDLDLDDNFVIIEYQNHEHEHENVSVVADELFRYNRYEVHYAHVSGFVKRYPSSMTAIMSL